MKRENWNRPQRLVGGNEEIIESQDNKHMCQVDLIAELPSVRSSVNIRGARQFVCAGAVISMQVPTAKIVVSRRPLAETPEVRLDRKPQREDKKRRPRGRQQYLVFCAKEDVSR